MSKDLQKREPKKAKKDKTLKVQSDYKKGDNTINIPLIPKKK